MNRLLLLINRLARRDRRSQKPNIYLKIVDVLLALVGVLVSIALISSILIVLLIVIFRFDLSTPTDATWLYQHQESETKVTGDQQIGGGYLFVFDGQDVWLRFRVKEDSVPTKPRLFEVCKPNQFAKIRQWFLENVRERSGFLSSLNPWTRLSEVDLQSLNDLNNLRCFELGKIDNKFGQIPSNAGWWMLYNSKTRLLYLRYTEYD
ncbi:hypothetical protein C7B65_16060 [Phormidesmis priestleyi ULC007]|uniref:Uncharacterized protein n=1 Tax=Phormidesmis priestleyi ULC007 TaxID=1920490 RepID=A0A2T1DCK9_9CYAN|nr:hypothetical protein [Phormidesmis priestleyi]PSB18218.1 hypothetical protein C7B65_16060 [Phormidesmis priestleyi ULC007]PZO49489.1 MAG: hypothetical protein DCF14_14095 [Phormidesmis priestleyi]